ncbi:hypothetical protein Tco_0163769 [Tanacetum coccineum]
MRTIVAGKELVDADLKRPFKETIKTPLTQRIIDFAAANYGEWPMPVWCRMFQQTLDGNARGWFERLPAGSIGEWMEISLLILFKIEGEDEMTRETEACLFVKREVCLFEEGDVFVLRFEFQSKGGEDSKKVNSRYVVENVLMECGGAYVGNEENKKYNKYKEGTLCKGI